jgi:hypothetical protein
VNEIEQRYTDSMFAARYPKAVLEIEEKRNEQTVEPQPEPAGDLDALSKSLTQATESIGKTTATISDIKRNKMQQAIGNLGALIQSWAEQLDKLGVKIQLPGGGEVNPTLKDVTVGDMGKVLEDMSFGFFPVRGAGMTKGLKPEAAELLNIPVLAAPVAAVAKIAKGGKAAKAAAGTAAAMVAADAPQPKKKDRVMKFDQEGRPQ